MRYARIFLILPVFLVTACRLDGITGVSPDGLEFSWEPAEHGQLLEEPELEISGDTGRLTVTSLLSAPNPCQRLSADLDRSGSTVTLRVSIVREGEACVAMIGAFRYTAIIRALPPGSYRTRVVHDYPGTGWPSGVVLDREVVVR